MRNVLQHIYASGLLLVNVAAAHDTWVQTNSHVVRVGDALHIDLLLGNHGNNHRDFKMAGKASTRHATLAVLDPGGERYELVELLRDVGYAPNEGYWTTPFVATEPGLYLVAHTLDQVMTYAPVRAVKSAKTCFIASESLDQVPMDLPGFDRVLGHELELICTANPVMPMGPEVPISVQLLYRGKPASGQTVSFIPRGETLEEGFDDRYERRTDDDGRASFTPRAGNYYLVVAHLEDDTARGEGYEKTKYSAALTVLVPQTCPCCAE